MIAIDVIVYRPTSIWLIFFNLSADPAEPEIIEPLLPSNNGQQAQQPQQSHTTHERFEVDHAQTPHATQVAEQPQTSHETNVAKKPPRIPQKNGSPPPNPVATYSVPRKDSPKEETHTEQSFSSRFMSSSSFKSSTRYSPVYKSPENHVDELKNRFEAMNERLRISFIGGRPSPHVTFSDDINPSVGSDTERDSDVNIQQIESTVSSISGGPSGSSAVNSPEAARTRRDPRGNWRVEQYETDF